jgi:hypothetical protein
MDESRAYFKFTGGSWHILRTDGYGRAVCGRMQGNRARSSNFLLHERTCETCLRLDAHFRAAVT